MVGVEVACTPKCCSKQHAREMISVVTKGTLGQVKMFSKSCCNATSLRDEFRKTMLQMAAACGKWDVVEWLIEEKGVDLKIQDRESGWTAMHGALFYGRLRSARILGMAGGSFSQQDREGLTPLGVVMKDIQPYVDFRQSSCNEVYTWGENVNFNLGHNIDNRRTRPEIVETLRKDTISIKQVVVCKYHTVFLTQAGQVFTCGHGQGGRLGLGDINAVMVPTLVEAVKSEKCIHIAAARDHTVMLMKSGLVYTCGLNDFDQLGQTPSPENSLLPKPVNYRNIKGRQWIGACAGRFHTVLYTEDAVFTFGLNAGQLGMRKGERIQSQPYHVTALYHKDVHIQQVVCSDAATVCATTSGDVYTLHDYQCRKIVSKWLDICGIDVCGGMLDLALEREVLRAEGGTELMVALQLTSGKAFIWCASDPYVKRLHWDIPRQLLVSDLSLGTTSITIATQSGEAFTGDLTAIHREPKLTSGRKSSESGSQQQMVTSNYEFTAKTLQDMIEKDHAVTIPVTRVTNVHRAVAVSGDKKSRNFAVLQVHPKTVPIYGQLKNFTFGPSVQSSEMCQQLGALREEADSTDCIHDVILKVGNAEIPAHKYILAYRSDYFSKLFSAKSEEVCLEEKPVVDIDCSRPHLFPQLLQFLYTDSCQLLRVGKEVPPNLTRGSSGKLGGEWSKDEEIGRSNGDGSSDIINKDERRKVSVFEVAAAKKRKKKDKEKKLEEGLGGRNENPVKLLQSMAKTFGVKSLAKRLEEVHYVAGRIESKVKHHQQPSIKFNRRKFQGLYDVSIRSEDNQLVKCHKCVLVARLEYFHSMLATGWIETSMSEALTLPVPGDILTVIVDFLYADDSPYVNKCTNVEMLCNILVVADQLLITRLREICEVAIANLITLKTVAELLEFATLYNAAQLKTTCQQFICYNLAALLEARSLDLLSEDVMQELTDYYRDMIPAMSRRHITPFNEPPFSELLEALEVEEEDRDDAHTTPAGRLYATPPSAKKSRAKKRRHRTKSSSSDPGGGSSGEGGRERQVSVCSEGSDLALEEVEEGTAAENKSVGITVKKKTPTITIPLRDFTRAWQPALQSPTSPSATGPSVWGPPSPEEVSMASSPSSPPSDTAHPLGLRQIMALEAQHKKPQIVRQSGTPGGKKGKLSQKERKKQLFRPTDGAEPTEGAGDAAPRVKVASPPANPWGSVNTVARSFRDLMISDHARSSTKVSGPKPQPGNSKPSQPMTIKSPKGKAPVLGPGGDTTLCWGLPVPVGRRSGDEKAVLAESQSSPKDAPWCQNVAAEQGKASGGSKAVRFSDIVLDELQQNETLVRTTNKPLALIQIEEQAIQELYAFYKGDETYDEFITVERVPSVSARPTWAAKSQQH